MADTIGLREAIRAEALALGFAEARFTPARAVEGALAGLAGYLADGRAGDMAWMGREPEKRADPSLLWPDARTVIVLGENYGPQSDPLRATKNRHHGAISVYAQGKDYHDSLKKRLKRLAGWLVERHGGAVKVFTDTAPIMEKPLAGQAGLGWPGRHTNLVSRRFGSWLFLGEVFTTLELPPDPPETDHCGSCRACEAACPTGALDGGRIDPRLCISYLTIEHKGMIPPALRGAIGNRIYGCDDCLAVCPWNKFAIPTAEADYHPSPAADNPALSALLGLDDAAFRQMFRGSPIKRIGRSRFLRNVLIAVGNSGAPELARAAAGLLADPDVLVRAMAVWAVRRVLGDVEAGRMQNPSEQDAVVLAEWRRPMLP